MLKQKNIPLDFSGGGIMALRRINGKEY